MSRKQKRVWWLVFAVIVLVAIAVAFVEARIRSNSVLTSDNSWSEQIEQTQDLQTQRPSARNLSLQPQAFNLARRLGKRFAAAKREISVMTGTLRVGSDRRNLQIARKQTSDGEQIQITFIDDSKSLTWDATNGALSSGSRATSTDRDLIERLLLDSPDQFVLAQLRGASYNTVARNVRPAEANDGYAGPLWNIVRVDDPQPEIEKQPESRWRLYYLNTTTGLIDRIVSEVQGQQVVAELTWTKSNEEQVPSRIVWTRSGQTIMQYDLGSFSHAEQEGAR